MRGLDRPALTPVEALTKAFVESDDDIMGYSEEGESLGQSFYTLATPRVERMLDILTAAGYALVPKSDVVEIL
jgi:hypothetical protein